jgi:glycogen phosphorylase
MATIPAWDAAEAEALYDLLEREVIPEFYARDESGIPTAWVARMRESMARLTPRFSANRAVREYTEQHYLPAAAAYRERAAEQRRNGQANGRLAAWIWGSQKWVESYGNDDENAATRVARLHLGDLRAR